MKNNKLLTIILVVIIIILGILIGVLIYSNRNNISVDIENTNNLTNNTNNTNTSNNTSADNYESTLGKVKTHDTFFDANGIINDYYNYISNGDKDALNSILEGSVNVDNILETKKDEISYVSKEMYIKSKNNVRYIFINGDENIYDEETSQLTEKENVMYLLIIDLNNNSYLISPINSKSLKNYADNYDINNIKNVIATDKNKYIHRTYSDEIITKYYISHFKNLIYLNTEKSYNMLSKKYSSKFADIEDYVNHIDEIYNKITSTLISYSINVIDGKRTYVATCSNNTLITMTENEIMDYDISIS